MDEHAIQLVEDYILTNLKENTSTDFKVDIIWKCHVNQLWKYVITTDLNDGMIYEVTYNGDKCDWYFNAFKKIYNKLYRLM